jgi:hypothetical protein
MIDEVKKVDPSDLALNAALFRDFQFLAAAYMLEACHLKYLKT